MILNAERKLY